MRQLQGHRRRRRRHLSRRCRVRLLLSESAARDARRRASSGVRHPLVPGGLLLHVRRAILHKVLRTAGARPPIGSHRCREGGAEGVEEMAGAAASRRPIGHRGSGVARRSRAGSPRKPPSTASRRALVELAVQRPSASEREKRLSMKNGMWVDAMREAMRSSRESKCCAVATRGHGEPRQHDRRDAAANLVRFSEDPAAILAVPKYMRDRAGWKRRPPSASLKAHLWATAGSTARLSTAARAPASPRMTMSASSRAA